MLTINDLFFILRLPRRDTVKLYDRLAPRYDRLHQRWLRIGGAASIAALQGSLAAELSPGARVLDAGCGTGALARWISEQEGEAHLTLLDAAPGMLERAGTIPGRTIHADITSLPFEDDEFDIVTCTWALETLKTPEKALAELKRVLAPGGLLCYCFCSAPDKLNVRLRSLWIRLVIERFFGGCFLQPDSFGRLAGGLTRRVQCHRGLSTFACYRKRDKYAATAELAWRPHHDA